MWVSRRSGQTGKRPLRRHSIGTSGPRGTHRPMSHQTSQVTRVASPTARAYQQCINPSCSATFAVDETHFACPACGDLIDVVYDWDRLPVPRRLDQFESKWAARLDPLNFSGV